MIAILTPIQVFAGQQISLGDLGKIDFNKTLTDATSKRDLLLKEREDTKLEVKIQKRKNAQNTQQAHQNNYQLNQNEFSKYNAEDGKWTRPRMRGDSHRSQSNY